MAYVYVREVEGENFGWFIQSREKGKRQNELGFCFLAVPCGEEHYVFAHRYGNDQKIDTRYDPAHSKNSAQQEINARALKYIRKMMGVSPYSRIKTCFNKSLGRRQFERIVRKRGIEFLFSTR